MKRYMMFLTGLFIMLVFNQTAQAATAALSPTSISISRNTSATRALNYTITDAMAASPIPFSSPQGVFRSGSKTLGTVNTVLSGSVDYINPVYVSENLTIPLSVIQKAEALGANSFQYSRTFTSSSGSSQTNLKIKLIGPRVDLNLRITRIQLYFKNRRAQITVKKREKGLRAFADIRYEGKGLFQAFWQLDGRLISRVNKQLSFGNRLTLKSPLVPELPTFQEGPHEVKLIITNPAQSFTPPRAVYYVRPQETEKTFTLELTNPLDAQAVIPTSTIFKWRDRRGLSAYLIQYTEENDTKTVFSAYTRKPQYRIPSYVLKHYFKAGKTYTWQVKGFDSKNNMVGESDTREFVLRP